MPYIECPECGQKALSVATRCPRCGHNYPARPLWNQAPASDLSRLRSLMPIAGVLVAGVLLVVALGRAAGPGAGTTVPAVPPADTAPVVGEPPPPPSPPSPAAEPVRAATTTVATAAPETRRYARTWVNVRGERASGAPPVRVLKPGEAVVVDSLRRGWYRVITQGRTVGYVHRSNLDAVPPPAQP